MGERERAFDVSVGGERACELGISFYFHASLFYALTFWGFYRFADAAESKLIADDG